MKIISVVLFLVRKCRKKKEIKTPLSFNFFGNKTREESESKFYFLLFFLQFLSNQTAVFFHRKRRVVVIFIFDIKPFLAARYAERRVESLKKRIQELQSEMDIANADLEESKRSKEAAEQELKGYEVELAMNEASIQTLEVCCSLTYPAIDWISSQIHYILLNYLLISV